MKLAVIAALRLSGAWEPIAGPEEGKVSGSPHSLAGARGVSRGWSNRRLPQRTVA